MDRNDEMGFRDIEREVVPVHLWDHGQWAVRMYRSFVWLYGVVCVSASQLCQDSKAAIFVPPQYLAQSLIYFYFFPLNANSLFPIAEVMKFRVAFQH